MTEHLGKLRAAGTVAEIHLKDLSTVHHEPQRLTQWLGIAREVVNTLWP